MTKIYDLFALVSMFFAVLSIIPIVDDCTDQD